MNNDLLELAREFKSATDDVKNTTAGIDARLSDIEQRQARPAGGDAYGSKSLGDQIAGDVRIKQFAENSSGKLRIEVKGTVTSGALSGGAFIKPQFVGNEASVALPYRALNLRSVLLQGKTSSNMVEFPRQTLRTSGVASVAELAAKPESALAWETAQAPVRTLAHLLPMSKQVFDDLPQLVSIVDQEMTYMLREVEEQQILMGDGLGQNLSGIYTTATNFVAPFAIASPTMLDQLLQAFAQQAEAGYDVDYLVMNPLDVARMLSIKTTDGAYLGNGPFNDSDVLRVWQTPIVPSKAMTIDKFLIGSRLGAQIFDRQQYTFEVSFDHADFFAKNMVMARLESRLALAVVRQNAYVKGDFGFVV